MATDEVMKNYFARFIGHEMMFMVFSSDFHGIFTNLSFIVRTDQEVDKYLQTAITLAQTDKKINNNKKKQNKTKTSKLFKLKITSKHSPTKNWAQGGDLFRLVRNAY